MQLFVQRPKERLRRLLRGDQKMALVARHKEPNFIHRKEVRDEPAGANSPRRLSYRGVGTEPSFARSKSLASTARLFGTIPEPNLRA